MTPSYRAWAWNGSNVMPLLGRRLRAIRAIFGPNSPGTGNETDVHAETIPDVIVHG